MSDSNNRFILYEYLSFFWKKKWLFLLLPIIGVVIAIGTSVVKEVGYVGTLSFYTGEVENEKLILPQLVENRFEEYSNLVVSQNGKNISFVITSRDKDEIESKLTNISQEYEEALLSHSEKMYESRMNDLIAVKEKIFSLEDSIKGYNAQVNASNLDPELRINYLLTIKEIERILYDYKELRNLVEFDVLNYVTPSRLALEITEEKSHSTSNVLLGFVLGLFLSIGLIILWKYILDAKKVKMS